jgi:hypothetical protein
MLTGMAWCYWPKEACEWEMVVGEGEQPALGPAGSPGQPLTAVQGGCCRLCHHQSGWVGDTGLLQLHHQSAVPGGALLMHGLCHHQLGWVGDTVVLQLHHQSEVPGGAVLMHELCHHQLGWVGDTVMVGSLLWHQGCGSVGEAVLSVCHHWAVVISEPAAEPVDHHRVVAVGGNAAVMAVGHHHVVMLAGTGAELAHCCHLPEVDCTGC